MSYRLGQSLPRPFSGYKYPKKKRRFVLPKRAPQSLNQSVSHGVTVTQSISSPKWVYRSVTQTVSASQSIVGGRVYLKSLSHSVTVTSTLSGTTRTPVHYIVSVSHDVTVSERLRPNSIRHLAVSHTVTATGNIKQGQYLSHTVTVTQSIQLQRILKRSVIHNVAVSDSPFINSPRALTVFHNVSVFDSFNTRLSTFRVSVTDNVTVTELIQYRNATYHLSVVHNVSTSHVARVIGAVYFKNLSDTVTVGHRVNLGYKVSVTHDVNVYHTYNAKRYITRTLTTNLSPTQNFSRDITYSLTTMLHEASIWSRQILVTRDFTTLIESKNNYDGVLFIQNPGPHPVVSGVNYVYGFLTLLETQYGTIVLPVPELNDSLKHNDKVSVKRTMSGVLKAYVKKGATTILTYTWLLDYVKALELKQWAITNFSEQMTLTNWKGEVWYGKIISDDLTLTAVSKYQGNPRQKTSVTIQFEGIKVNG